MFVHVYEFEVIWLCTCIVICVLVFSFNPISRLDPKGQEHPYTQNHVKMVNILKLEGHDILVTKKLRLLKSSKNTLFLLVGKPHYM